MSGVRKEGTLSKGPTLRSESVKGNHHRAIRRHGHDYGGLLSFENALAQARFMIREMRRQGPIARESADALARCLRTVRAEIARTRKARGAKSPELVRQRGLLYDAIALGFTLAYLLVERADQRKPDGRKRLTIERYRANKKPAQSRKAFALSLEISEPGLRKFEEKMGLRQRKETI